MTEALPVGEARAAVRRRDQRHPVRLTVLVHHHGRFRTVRIVDFSLGGLQLVGCFGEGPGDEVAVELLSGHRLSAMIAWSMGSRVGVRFLQPLAPEDPALGFLRHAAQRTLGRATVDADKPDTASR